MDYLPATTYNAPPRLGRGRFLKTIRENEETSSFGLKSDSEGDESDRTIIARPAGLDAKLAAVPTPTTLATLSRSTYASQLSSVESSPCSSIDEGSQHLSARESYCGSDVGTVFSEDSCPSLTGSNDTSFYTNSNRNSVASNSSQRQSRNRYPSILIPRDSWHDANQIKEVALGMSPAHKILLSPQALSRLPQHIPSLHAPPSLGGGSSITSGSPSVLPTGSAPITPDLHNLVPVNGQPWGGHDDQQAMTTPLEIAVDEEHSILLSPAEAHSQRTRDSTGYSTDWSDVVVRFPKIPGATPQEQTPIEPNVRDMKVFDNIPSEHGVQLPSDALHILQHLTRSYSPDLRSDRSGTSRAGEEMRQRSETQSRPRSVDGASPLSEYSFSNLSIPSPGGFFSSLQANSRSTWCASSQPKTPLLPDSAIAANFYNIPFQRPTSISEVILEIPDKEGTDGPPTARQAGFDLPAEYLVDSPVEEDNFYLSHDLQPEPSRKPSPGNYEYDETYEEDLKQTAGHNIDRTSDWLSAQTTYLSALRESNPLNDPADFIPQTPHPLTNGNLQNDVEESPARKAVRFLEEATKAATPGATLSTKEGGAKESVFLEAFEHCVSLKGRHDVFLQAAIRLESINTVRLALPDRHMRMLLNDHTTETLQTHVRPKYRGPFSQNPRATGIFHRTKEQILFAEAERKQLAINQILPVFWQTEAQRKILHQGRLLACPTAVEKITIKSKDLSKTLRILDLAGAATGSWAWSAAQKWPNVKITTVQTKAHSQLSLHSSVNDDQQQSVKPSTPENHRVVTVPELWKLPFRANFFDVISARTLHMFLRSRPVPEVPSIDEWDLTLKECMRVLKPGGVLDFIVLDSHISNNSSENSRSLGKKSHRRNNSSADTGFASISPSAIKGQGFSSTTPPPTSTHFTGNALTNPTGFDFGRELKKRGYEADGGCSKLMARLKKSGFTGVKRQWVGLPVGRTGPTHENVLAGYADIDDAASASLAARAASPDNDSSKQSLQRMGSVSQANGRSRTPFPPAPRPISEVSSISRIIEQYSNVEAVQGPVGSTADISDMAGLLGTMMWEEWAVRLRLEIMNGGRSNKTDSDDNTDASFEAANLLHGINEILAAGYAKGACFRGIIGWARKPSENTKKTSTKAATIPATDSVRTPVSRFTPKLTSSPVVAAKSAPKIGLTSSLSRRNAQRPSQINTHTAETYRSRAAARLASQPSFDGYPRSGVSGIETPSTANTIVTARAVGAATPSTAALNAAYSANHFFGGAETPVDQTGALRLDTRGIEFGSPEHRFYTESAVERGEVGIIPMMIVE